MYIYNVYVLWLHEIFMAMIRCSKTPCISRIRRIPKSAAYQNRLIRLIHGVFEHLIIAMKTSCNQNTSTLWIYVLKHYVKISASIELVWLRKERSAKSWSIKILRQSHFYWYGQVRKCVCRRGKTSLGILIKNSEHVSMYQCIKKTCVWIRSLNVYI
jgi:hypothetical protein